MRNLCREALPQGKNFTQPQLQAPLGGSTRTEFKVGGRSPLGVHYIEYNPRKCLKAKNYFDYLVHVRRQITLKAPSLLGLEQEAFIQCNRG